MSKTPSRKRYEKENPVVSFRVSREAKEKLEEVVEEGEMSKKEWFENLISGEESSFKKSYRRGIERGKKIYGRYVVEYPCDVCGEELRVESEEEKEVCRDALSSWGHKKCHS